VLYLFSFLLVLEDEYERKRWDRKFHKYRGRPKKRSKREVSLNLESAQDVNATLFGRQPAMPL